MKRKSRILILASVLLLASLACNLPAMETSTPRPTRTPKEKTATTVVETPGTKTIITPQSPTEAKPPVPTPPPPPKGVYGPAFANYSVVAVTLPESFAGGYSLPVNLSKIKGVDLVTLTEAQKTTLSKNGFVVSPPVPGKYKEFYSIYEAQRYADNQPIFATTDAVFHVYHLIFDKMLRDLERDSFIPTLEKLTPALLKASYQQYQSLKGTPLEEPALRNVAFFGVAAQLLGLPDPIPAEASDLVNAEVSLINAHNGAQVSPLWDRPDLPDDQKLIEDYSQYIPRGHYTLSEALQRYFKTMMWYGRLTYRLKDTFETQRALLVTQALRSAKADSGETAVQLWQNIYEPTVFIVGKADDLSYFEYGALSDQIFGENAAPQAFADDTRMAQFVEAARKLPAPQVNSMWVWIWQDKQQVTQGFRFMGQRFTLDEYVFGQLIWRNVGTQDKPRGLPMGLDFFAAMNSDEALNILNNNGETQYVNYNKQMDKVRKEVSALGVDSWTQNLYWSWLYAFQPMIQPKDARYPAFMQNQAWTRKDLQTALGSWTELKHDTILYAKQVMAEMGGGGPDIPPHGYVEPNPEAYARLLSLAQMTYDGLKSRNLLSTTTQTNLENLMDLLKFMQSVAERELSGGQITKDEYWRIQYFGGSLESMTIAASDCEQQDNNGAGCRNLGDRKAALVADVATGIGPDGSLLALEEGEGQPTEIYVVLPDQPWRVAVGAVFTYYEFPVPPAQRMTDEQWQAQVEHGSNPPAPDWTKMFIVP